jgi:transcriptional regulator with XRE-family HTH domain
LNRSHYSKLEQNGSRPTFDTIIKLAIGLDMPLDEFAKALDDKEGFKMIFDELPER